MVSKLVNYPIISRGNFGIKPLFSWVGSTPTTSVGMLSIYVEVKALRIQAVNFCIA